LTNHYDADIAKIEKYNPDKIWSLVYFEGEQQFYYLKRFKAEGVNGRMKIMGEHTDSKFVIITDASNAVFELEFTGKHKDKENRIVNAVEFIAEKGSQAKGKRLTNYMVKKITEIIDTSSEIEHNDNEDNNDIDYADPEFEVIKTDEDGNQTILDI
jgi:topoisomerase-4 subunit A